MNPSLPPVSVSIRTIPYLQSHPKSTGNEKTNNKSYKISCKYNGKGKEEAMRDSEGHDVQTLPT